MDRKKKQTNAISNRSIQGNKGRTNNNLHSQKKMQQVDNQSHKTDTEKNFNQNENRMSISSHKKKNNILSDSTYMQESNQKSNYTLGDKSFQTQMTEKKQFNHNITSFNPDAVQGSIEFLDTKNPYVQMNISQSQNRKVESSSILNSRPENNNQFKDSTQSQQKNQEFNKSSLILSSINSGHHEAVEQKASGNISAVGSPKKNMSNINESFKPQGRLIPRESHDDIQRISIDNLENYRDLMNPTDSFQNIDQRFTFGDQQKSIGNLQYSVENLSSPSKNNSCIKLTNYQSKDKISVDPNRVNQNHKTTKKYNQGSIEDNLNYSDDQQQNMSNQFSNNWVTPSVKNNSNIKRGREKNTSNKMNSNNQRKLAEKDHGQENQSVGKTVNYGFNTQQISVNDPYYQIDPSERNSDIRSGTLERKSIANSPVKKETVESITDRQLASYKEGIEQSFSASPIKSHKQDNSFIYNQELIDTGKFKDSPQFQQHNSTQQQFRDQVQLTHQSSQSYNNSYVSGPNYQSQKPPVASGKNVFKKRNTTDRMTPEQKQDQLDQEVSMQVRKLQDITRQKRAEYYEQSVNDNKSAVSSSQRNSTSQAMNNRMKININNKQYSGKIVRANHELRNVSNNFNTQQNYRTSINMSQPMSRKSGTNTKDPRKHYYTGNEQDKKALSKSLAPQAYNSKHNAVTQPTNQSHNYLRKLKMDYKIKETKSPARPQSAKQQHPKKETSVYKMTKVSFVSNKASDYDKKNDTDSKIGSRNGQDLLKQFKRQSFITDSTQQNNKNEVPNYNSNFTSFNKSDLHSSEVLVSNTMKHINVQRQDVESPILSTLKIPSKIVSYNSQIDKPSAKGGQKKMKTSNTKVRRSMKKRKSSQDITTPNRSKSPILQTTSKMDESLQSNYSTNNYYRRKLKQYKVERSISREKLSDRKKSASANNLQDIIDTHNNDKFSSKQSHRYSPFRSNDHQIDLKSKTMNNQASKVSSIRSPMNGMNCSRQSEYTAKNNFSEQQSLNNDSKLMSPTDVKKINKNLELPKKDLDQQSRQSRQTRNEILSPKIIQQQSSIQATSSNPKSPDPKRASKKDKHSKSLIIKKKKSYQESSTNALERVEMIEQQSQSKLIQPTQLNQSFYSSNKGKTPIDLVYEELNMSSNKTQSRKREPIKPFKSQNQWSQHNSSVNRSGVSPSKSSTHGRNSIPRVSQVQRQTKDGEFQNVMIVNKNRDPSLISMKSQIKEISEIQIDIDPIKLEVQNQEQLKHKEYIQNTGIENFKLVKGDHIRQRMSGTNSLESLKNQNQESPQRMININNFVQANKNEEKNEDEITITERTNNSAMQSVRKQIKNIDEIKMLQVQIKMQGNGNTIIAPPPKDQSRNSKVEMVDETLSDIQQENSEYHQNSIGNNSLMQSAKSLGLKHGQGEDSKMYPGNVSSVLGFSDNQSQMQGGGGHRRAIMSDSPGRFEKVSQIMDSSKSNGTGTSYLSYQRKLTQEQQKYVEQINNSYLGLSNNPSSCQRSNGRANSLHFNEQAFYQMQQQNFIQNPAFMQDNFLQDSGGNPFDQPMIINPADINAGFDSMARSQSNAPDINSRNQQTSPQNETKDDETSQDSEDPQYLADLNLFMNSTKEQSEDELKRIDKRLTEVSKNVQNIQYQIREQRLTQTTESIQQSRFFQNLLSLLDHHLHQQNYLVQRHQSVRQDIVKLQNYQEEQKRLAEQKRQEEERFRQFYQRRLQKLQQQQQQKNQDKNQDKQQQQQQQKQAPTSQTNDSAVAKKEDGSGPQLDNVSQNSQLILKPKNRMLSPQGGQTQGMSQKK